MKPLNVYISGSPLLVEQCPKITVSETLAKVAPRVKEQLLKAQFNIQGFDVDLATSQTSFGGERFWFKCPICGKRAGVLFQHPVSSTVGCRPCLGLEYRSRRYKGMLEARF